MGGTEGTRVEGGDEVGHGADGGGELGEVAADDVRLVGVAGTGGREVVAAGGLLDEGSEVGCDVVADEFEGVEGWSVLGEDGVEILPPAVGVGGDDGGVEAANQGEQVGQQDAGLEFVGVVVGEAINEEVAFEGGDLDAGEDEEASGPGIDRIELVWRPLAVVLGDDDRVEAEGEGAVDQFIGVDDAVGGVSVGVEVMIDSGHGNVEVWRMSWSG